jgi:hypothetical protein
MAAVVKNEVAVGCGWGRAQPTTNKGYYNYKNLHETKKFFSPIGLRHLLPGTSANSKAMGR